MKAVVVVRFGSGVEKAPVEEHPFTKIGDPEQLG